MIKYNLIIENFKPMKQMENYKMLEDDELKPNWIINP